MRPINLIPEEERRAHGGTLRTGPVAYALVGGLGLLLIGVVMLVLASNQISDRESEVESLEARKAVATARAERLAPYTSFEQVAQQRIQSITEVADGRFDWERVFRQLALVLPPNLNLTSISGSSGGGAEGGETGLLTPSFSLEGCAPSQNLVAATVASLKEIDGVTRVGLESSSTSEEGGGEGCPKGRPVEFKAIVAFDEAPPSIDSGEEIPVEAPAETAEGAASETESSESAGAGESSEGTASNATTEPAG
jgi:Tfp pilus assembly protein PilN